ncbi:MULTISPECIES: HU family DNA-binding protein [unclassified Campylobacter]|uniref:HU family DNA-binding protein n=1 Tax=unclassified Campylobacter TaxID=2593542 RepID=UPI001BDA9D27|nr:MULTISPECIES: HU family DNA-binding protein [unclassified Campylobacter]MBZ7976631.1 HU family DNA-binding protein [Campylobacter sp. RM12637]MBZ7978644.1 HU family DNA-binding protein [Campylobacter sp. RM12654]MBZ7980709.1 HU family DNA-binding protein [Campylobacter sp. RM12642]MBZ7982563.1 HU family DNA-binding protein [Campylobacter sp. RM12640]MBZ7984609.1 HU family DNA-binding protein [Campylobacter sp. RM12647]MBZ7989792.1 HU family DNA-binding protein [Campylobacter sp. RM12635]M
MTKADFISLVAEKAEITKKDATTAVNAVFEALAESLEKGESIPFNGFGTFSTTDRAERTARVPSTGKEIKVPATKVVKFKVSSVLKEKVAATACKTGKCGKKKK